MSAQALSPKGLGRNRWRFQQAGWIWRSEANGIDCENLFLEGLHTGGWLGFRILIGEADILQVIDSHSGRQQALGGTPQRLLA
ncbi:hypothetical protein [Chromobacterium vaccinii]|uniref:hypothetical protein n=1 Tax=Chromobacterium vaccinii TaxID=1108595 RepID=UPI0011C01C1D|nr:hypothetical protein [Chromobacterium vaccinii]